MEDTAVASRGKANPLPWDHKSNALPTELKQRSQLNLLLVYGGTRGNCGPKRQDRGRAEAGQWQGKGRASHL